MKQELYVCDNCKKVLSNDGVGKLHLSIMFGNYSGWVEPQLGIDLDDMRKSQVLGWKHFEKVNGVKQFCNGKCLGEYFDKLVKKEICKKKKKK